LLAVRRLLKRSDSDKEPTMTTAISPLLSFTLALLDGAGFAPIGGHSQVEVYQRQNTADIELAAVGEIEGSPAEVQAVLADYAHHRSFVPRLAESRVLETHPGEEIVYQHLKLPVISDRDYVLRVTWEEGQSKGLRFSIANERGPAAKRGMVRMTTLTGRWDLEPIRGGRATRATYRVHIDFAGAVPRWMVSGGAAKELPGLYDGIRYEVTTRRLRTPTAVSTAQR
jgi:Polyketide cyclase / dehydrase and lipid transport